MRFAYKSFLDRATAHIPKIGKLVDFILKTAVQGFLLIHILTCIWIKLGSGDTHNDWEEMEPSDRTWFFIPGTDFSADERSIYEQVIDEDSDMGLSSLYLYASYWVLTVVTTVGYGHANYYTSSEYLYTCFLEVLATLIQALCIIVLSATFKINEYSFEYQLWQRLSDTDEWMAFKIQNQHD